MRAVALDISKAFDMVWHAVLLYKLKSYENSGEVSGLISSFLSNRQLGVGLDVMFSQEYPVHAGVRQGSILGPTLFLLYINDLPDDAICNISIYADDTTDLIYETLWTGAGNGLLISVLEKLNWFRLTCLITLVLFM